MDTYTLSQLKDITFGELDVGVFNFRCLERLLGAMIAYMGLQDLPVLKQGHDLIPLLGGQLPTQEQPKDEGGQAGGLGPGHEPLGPEKDPLQAAVSSSPLAPVGHVMQKIEENRSGVAKAMAVTQDLLEEMAGMKAAQSHMAAEMQKILKALGLEGSGGQPAPTDSLPSDADHSSESSPLQLEGPRTQPVARTGKGTPGTQPGSLRVEAGVQTASVTPEQWAGAASEGTRTSDAEATSPGVQPRSPGTTTPVLQSGSPREEIITPAMEPGSPGREETMTPGMQPGTSSSQSSTPGMKPGCPSIQITTPESDAGTLSTDLRMQPALSGTQEEGAVLQQSHPGMKPVLPGAVHIMGEVTPGGLGTQRDTGIIQLAQPRQPAAGTLSVPAQGVYADARAESPAQERTMAWGCSGSISAPSYKEEAAEALRQVEQLHHLYAALKEQVLQLEASLSDHRELEKQLRLHPEEGSRSPGDTGRGPFGTGTLAGSEPDPEGKRPPHWERVPLGHDPQELESITSILSEIQGQVSSLQGLASDLQAEKGKIRQLEDAMEKLYSSGKDQSVDGSDEIAGRLGSMLQELKSQQQELKSQQQELKSQQQELKSQQQELGKQHEVTKATLQRVLREAAEQQQKQPDKLRALGESAGQEPAEGQAACPTCNKDIGVQLGLLLQRYETLQEVVDSLVGKVARQEPGRKQDLAPLKDIQAALKQTQADCMNLSSVTGSLQDDLQRTQKDIEALFLSLEKLQKQKEDMEELFMAISMKADSSTLARKVSRSQFDACMEGLNDTIQETQRRVTGLEQVQQQVQQQLSQVMDSKLDRRELGPFGQQLEQRWERVLDKKVVTPAAEDAAGIKKQLLEHFHCLSCDQPLSMRVPGPEIKTIPLLPPMSPRLTWHPRTVPQQKQASHHGQREQAAECKYPRVPRQCGGQHTLTKRLPKQLRFLPVPASTPWTHPPRTLPPIKAGPPHRSTDHSDSPFSEAAGLLPDQQDGSGTLQDRGSPAKAPSSRTGR